MNRNSASSPKYRAWAIPLVMMVALGALLSGTAKALVVNVVDETGAPITGGFRWLVEEDRTLQAVQGAGVGDSLALNLHTSHAPTVASGSVTGASVTITIPNNKRYIVSVLPSSGGYTMNGANIALLQATVTIMVHVLPIPTAQISIYVFNDNNPINNEPDQPEEVGLPNFSIIIHDNIGQLMQDAFANPIGTTYQMDAFGNPILDPDGHPIPDQMGDGTVLTDANGEAWIKYLAPGKYGIIAVPPGGETWIQTATIEGTPSIDAWAKAGEPPQFIEFGPAFYHVFYGFVQPMNLISTIPNPTGITGTVSGQFVNQHLSRAPIVRGYPGAPISEAWVGVNDNTSLQGLYAQPCNADGTFTIAGLPPGTYQIVFWDFPLDYVCGTYNVTVPTAGGPINMGQLPVFGWFGALEGSVFNDVNENGFRDPTEAGIPDTFLNLRYRSGAVYQTTRSDKDGNYAFSEVFPFFNFLVAEVNYGRYKATGATMVVDAGGPVPSDNGWAMPSRNKLTPQAQAQVNPNTGNNLSRTETALEPIVTEASSLYLGQTNVIDWGKAAYTGQENGGIYGITVYASMRTESDPRYAKMDPWEPGIPRVVVNLYSDFNYDGIIDDYDGNGVPTLSDVDNYPFGNFPGPEDVDWNHNGVFNPGDAIMTVTSDSWDDNQPTGCPGTPFYIHNQLVRDCYDNLRCYNQMRPGVFDGGYRFTSYVPGGIVSGGAVVDGLPTGQYIVEGVRPVGYEDLKEEDKNIDFGETYIPSINALPPACVGDPHVVPAEMSLFPGHPAPFAGETRPLCNRKLVYLGPGTNAPADFHFFTYVPKAAQATGLVTNDLAPEFDPNSPISGEKASPSWIPIAFRDFSGHEVVRVYCDEWGSYDAMLPSTYTMLVPIPNGLSSNILTTCLNDPGPIPDPAHPGQFITDPWFDPSYSQSDFELDFYPGTTTYLDTPILPLAAFREVPNNLLDCAFPDGTPLIYTVSGPTGGPYVSAVNQTLTIASVGSLTVPNPAYDITIPGSQPTIRRSYSFGSVPGTVTIGGVAMTNLVWASDGLSVSGTVATGTQSGELTLTRGDNHLSTPVGITVHVGAGGHSVIHVSAGQSIQTAINNAANGDLILIAPGRYDENLVMWKNIRLQGWGAYATEINAVTLNYDPAKLTAWTAYVQHLIDTGAVDLVPGQSTANPFADSFGSGILVLVRQGLFTPNPPPRIDGLMITGGVVGSAIHVNGYADYLEISNNFLQSNQGVHGGGISVGTPSLVDFGCDPFCDSQNNGLRIYNNEITRNGGIIGGGGISLYYGSDNYDIHANFICGNFSAWNGGGICHYGLSDGGNISNNKILFNEAYYGTTTRGDGGGIYFAGEPAAAGGLGSGAGTCTILSNLIQGNLAGSGEGAGIASLRLNGTDVQASPHQPSNWYELRIFNNMIVNNGAAFAGGGIGLIDSARVKIINNTIADNDGYSVSIDAFGGVFGSPLNLSTPQVGGIISNVHTPALQAAIGTGTGPEYAIFSNPILQDDIIWHNRSFYWDASLNAGLGGLLPNPTLPNWDLQVIGGAATLRMDPEHCILSSTSGYSATNRSTNPSFVLEYANIPVTAAVADEGGNFVSAVFHPLTYTAGNYHIRSGSPAIGLGAGLYLSQYAELQRDYDLDLRTAGHVDSGADEFSAATALTPQFIGVFNNGTWNLDRNGNGQWDGAIVDILAAFGAAGDTPVTGDWNGNGRTKIGTFRAGVWNLDYNGNARWDGNVIDRSYVFNPAGLFDSAENAVETSDPAELEEILTDLDYADAENAPSDADLADLPDLASTMADTGAADRVAIPITGDWNGDGRTEIGIYNNGTWYLDYNGNGHWDGPPGDRRITNFGSASALPVTGHWGGSTATRIGYFTGGHWYLDWNGNGVWDGPGIDVLFNLYGTTGDVPIPGDWNGDHSTELGTFNRAIWHLDFNGNGVFDGCTIDKCFFYMRVGDVPVVGRW